MNRIFSFGIAMFIAIVGISLINGERQADAAFGFSGCSCSGAPASCAPVANCSGRDASSRFFGNRSRSSCSGDSAPAADSCSGRSNCCGRERFSGRERCSGRESCSGRFGNRFRSNCSGNSCSGSGASSTETEEESTEDTAPPALAPEASASVRTPVRYNVVSFRR